MKVSEIIDITNKRCKIYIDSEFAFVLYKGELSKYKIKLDEEIEEDFYQDLIRNILPKRAKLRAMNLLKVKDYTEYKLREKLKDGYYSSKIIDEVIEYLKGYHYIDDLRYARDYIFYHAEHKSLRMMEQSLLQKGISKEIYKLAYIEWQENGGKQNEIQMILKLLEKKKYNNEISIKEKNKIYHFLIRRGFSIQNINKAMNIVEEI